MKSIIATIAAACALSACATPEQLAISKANEQCVANDSQGKPYQGTREWVGARVVCVKIAAVEPLNELDRLNLQRTKTFAFKADKPR